MIRLENINKRFRRLQVLENVSASFEKGQVISLLGPNGSGKTTLIKIILGMVRRDSGEVFVNNQPINGDPSYRASIGYMPQIGRYPDNMKVRQLFEMMIKMRGAEKSSLDEDLVFKFNIRSIFEKPMRTLSGGTRQKVSAALAFLFNPSVLILDEPTAGLDPLASEILKNKISGEKAKNKLILITSHILSDLEELTTHIMYLQEGKMQFLKQLSDLQEETGELKLSKAIAKIMSGYKPDGTWLNKILSGSKDEKIY